MPSPSFTEFATIRNGKDITRGFVEFLGNYIPTQDSLLIEKSGGLLDLYEKVLQDDRVKSCYQQRFSGLTSKEIEVVPGGDKRIDKQAAEHIQYQLEQKLNWDSITEKMSYGIHYGYSIAECIYGREDGKVILTDIKVRNRRRFHFGYDELPKLKTFTNPLGEDLPPQKFWHFCTGADNDDEPYGLGLGHWLYWLAWFKRNDLKYWITFLENFADPSTIGHYPIGATEQQKKTLQGAVMNIGKTKWATLPEGMLIELLEASRSGTADYQGMHDALNTAISTLILSQSMTSESGSSEAQATVHKDVGDTVIEADDALISSSFNASVVTWLTNWNFPGAAIPRVRRKLEPPEDLKGLADTSKIVVDMGFPMNPEYVVKTWGEGFQIPMLEPKPAQLNAAELTAFAGIVGQAQTGGWSKEMTTATLEIAFPHILPDAIAKLAKAIEKSAPDPNADPNAQPPSLDDAAGQFAAPDPDLVDSYVDKMLEIDSFKPWLLQAKELLMQSSDLDEYAEKLIDLYPEMPSDDFVATMRDAMTAASLGGYFDASEDDGLDGELEFKMLGDEGVTLLIDSMFDNYTLESIQLDAVASLL